MIAKNYWKDFYKSHSFGEPSPFALWARPFMDGSVVDLGCGDGRDVHYFLKTGLRAYGVDASNEDILIVKQDVNSFVKENPSPQNVYTRFFWHAIDTPTRENILSWVKGNLFIEARTTKDKPKNLYGKHDRNLVDTKELIKQLEDHNFTILKYMEGYGMSRFFDEDPHLVRVVASRVV